MDNKLNWDNTENDNEKPEAPNAYESLRYSIIGLVVTILMIIILNITGENDVTDTIFGAILIGGLVMSIIGLVKGINGSKMIKGSKSEYSNASKLTTGIVLGIIGIVIWAVVIIMGFLFILATEGIEGLL